MHIYSHLEDFKSVKNPVVTMGTFDGVHAGHIVVIQELKEAAARVNGESVLFTFHPHPRTVLFPDDNDLKLLNTIEEKTSLLKQAGIEHLIIHPFDKEFSRISSWNFVRDILVNKINVKQLIIGYNHHFGKNREGSFEDLQEYASLYNFNVKQIAAHTLNNISISSTKIRQALNDGDISTANTYLNYDYSITGKVVDGNKIGNGIGFPTANIEINDKNKLIPAHGVYAVLVKHNEKLFKGMLNIGVRPTLNETDKKIEVHIIDFSQRIYNQHITILFKEKIRDEKKFGNLEELREQLIQDKYKIVEILNI